MSCGLFIFILGIFKKVFIADNLAVYNDLVYLNYLNLSSFEILLFQITYTFQIFFDFSGYTDMAIGLGLLFGFKLPINFDDPLKSRSIIDFWQKWHITMSRFFRIYIFFPLAFKLESKYEINNSLLKFVLTFITPISITFLLTGLWHGANWNFIIFGLIHAIFIIINQINKVYLKLKINKYLSTILVFFCFSISLIYFRSEDISIANYLIYNLFSIDIFSDKVFNTQYFLSLKYAFFILISLYFTYYYENFSKTPKKIVFNLKRSISTFFMLLISIFSLTEERPFIYFQF